MRGVKYTNPLPAMNSTPISRKVRSVSTVKPMPHSAGPSTLVPISMVTNPMIRFITLVIPVPKIFLNMHQKYNSFEDYTLILRQLSEIF